MAGDKIAMELSPKPPQKGESKTGEYWADIMATFDAVFSNLESYKNMMRFAIDSLADSQNVLDSSAGTGHLTLAMLDQGKSVTALDLHQGILAPLAAKKEAYGSRLKIVVGDGTELPFLTGSFDGMASLQVLPYVDSPDAYLAEHARVLAPGGRLVVSGPSSLDLSSGAMVMVNWYNELKSALGQDRASSTWGDFVPKLLEMSRSGPFKQYSKDEITDMLVQSGDLSVVDITDNPLYYGSGYLAVAEKLDRAKLNQ